MDSESPKVLISYTHDSPHHKARVLNLSQRLREEGVDCHIDQYEDSPLEGWPRWMADQIDQADFVLVVATETYQRRFLGREESGRGLGAQWEGAAITQDIYEQGGKNNKFIPIVFATEDSRFIPGPLRSATYYPVYTEDGYEDLYRRLTRQPRVHKRPLGAKRVFDTVNEPPSEPAKPEAPLPADTNLQSQGPQLEILLIYKRPDLFECVPAKRIEKGTTLEATLKPANSRQTAFLTDLQSQWHNPLLGVAYGDTAMYATVESSKTVHEGGEALWQIAFQQNDEQFGASIMSDFSFNGFSADEIADLRARSILLNEKPGMPGGRGRLDVGMIEAMITRGSGPVTDMGCPLPGLFNRFGADPGYFAEVARLMLILYLKASGTVDHVFTLSVELLGGTEAAVEFEGQRRARYANAAPIELKISGNCKLK